jgi:hypothetical protein
VGSAATVDDADERADAEARVTLKCIHCGIVFEYQRPAGHDAPGVIAELAECPKGHTAIVSESPGLAASRLRAKVARENEK